MAKPFRVFFVCALAASLYLLVMPLPAAARDAVLAELFARRNTDGTLVLSSLKSGRTFVHNDERSNRRFAVASTFKILNSLIALEEKVATGKDHVIRWNGRRHEFSDWNRDQTLESAFRVSCVWYYQELARLIGAGKYRDCLKRSGYGKLREPFDTTTFWLDGSLEISASEQTDFLRNVYLRKLPFSDSSYKTLREIMVAERNPDFSIYGKTGWAASVKPQTGWYVGYLETHDEVWFFALNMDIRSETDLPLRKQLVREALVAKGIIR